MLFTMSLKTEEMLMTECLIKNRMHLKFHLSCMNIENIHCTKYCVVCQYPIPFSPTPAFLEISLSPSLSLTHTHTVAQKSHFAQDAWLLATVDCSRVDI